MVKRIELEQAFSNKKVLITGHTGFKGSWLTILLQLLGARVKGYALAPETDPCLFHLAHPLSGMDSVIADIRNKERLKKEIRAFMPDYIFHLAAQPLVRRSYEIPAETFEVNVIGTANLLEALVGYSQKCTVTIVTTDKVYENKEQDQLYVETDRLGGYDPYSASKACTELVVDSFRRAFFHPANIENHQIALATVRAGNVIGGGDYSQDRLLPDIVSALEQGQSVAVRNPESVRPWQHVLEPLTGYLALAARLHTDIRFSGAWNFGPRPEDHLTVKEMVTLALAAWGGGSWHCPDLSKQPHEAGLLKLDSRKAMRELDWQPRLSAAAAIDFTIDWYKHAPGGDPLVYTREQMMSYLQ